MDSPFHSFCSLIRSLDQNDDSIVLDQKLKYLAGDINDIVEGDEHMLWSALMYFNERALEESEFAINFALLFTSHYFDGLREHLQLSDGNSIFRAHILNMLQQNYTNAEKLKSVNKDHFYNSVTLMGEFYNRMYKKSNPALVIGRSLLELLTKELRSETVKCFNDATHVFSVRFARLLLTQITLNGPLAKNHHQNEIDTLFFDIRKCLIEIENLTSVTKAFLLMSLDLYYNGFKSIDTNLEKFYSKFLDDHDTNELRRRPPSLSMTDLNSSKADEPANSTYNLRNLKKDFAGLKTNYRINGSGGGRGDAISQGDHRKINREYLNRPLKASDRLKYFQNSNSELSRDPHRHESAQNKHSNARTLKESSSEGNISQNNAINNNESNLNDYQCKSESLPVQLTVSTNCQESPKSDGVASPTGSQDTPHISPPKLETFNWFEAVEQEEYGEYIAPNNLNNSGSGSNKFDTLSVASYSSNATSPQERTSPQSSHTNRSRRNSLNRFRSDSYYRQSNEDLHQSSENTRPNNRNESKQQQQQQQQKQNYHNSWRNTGRNSPRNDSRNGFTNKRNDRERNDRERNDRERNDRDYDRDRENSNNVGANYNRRNLVRGGSVDSKVTNTRQRHDSFNRRNQENDNFEHFQSYNRKSYSRSKDSFSNRTPLPPRLQQKWQQQRSADYKNDCDNPKRFNNRNNTNNSINANKAVSGRTE